MRVARRVAVLSLVLWISSPAVGAADLKVEDLRPEEKVYLEEFTTALDRFRSLSLEEFLAEYSSGKEFLRPRSGTFVRADPNRDGQVDLSDAICILHYLFLGTRSCARADCLDALDADDSGGLDISDAIGLLDHLFRGAAAPRAPYPGSGTDPTDDGIACPAATRLGYEPMEAEYLVEIFNAYLPSVRQEDAFRENGFVIYKNVKYESMLQGFFEVYRRDLPVYISVDSILDALHLSFDRLLIQLEEGVLSDELAAMLGVMESGLAGAQAEAAAQGVAIEAELNDAAIWICTARSLLQGEKAACVRGVDEAVNRILALVAAEQVAGLDLFGAWREEDFSQFTARGHYTRSEALGRYFQAMMWVQRIGLRLAEEPREARAAWLFTHLLEATGAIGNWKRLNDAIARLIGFSDSATPPDLGSFMADRDLSLADLADGDPFRRFAQAAIAAGLGRQRINSQILRKSPFDPEFIPFPNLFHVLGQRFTVDSFTFQNVVFDRVPERADGSARLIPSPLDAMFVLGNRDVLPLLEGELRLWGYQANLAALDWILSSYADPPSTGGAGGLSTQEGEAKVYPSGFWQSNLYNVWLSALKTLHADTTSERYPPVMRTGTWSRRMLNAQLASWAHQRHDFVLNAKESYPPDGCMYPTGWVDPYPEFYETLAAFAGEAREVFESLGVGGKLGGLETVCRQLAAIARAELAGQELTEEQSTFMKKWLFENGGYREGSIPRTEPIFFDGWYPRIIFDFDGYKGEPFDPTIASVHTYPGGRFGPPAVLHVGAGHPNLGLISVKTECGLRAYAGPVLSYHEFVEPEMHRWTDEEWKAELEAGGDFRPAWTGEFVK